MPVQPQSRAVPMARAARLAAPRAEAAFPPRSLVVAITGADSGVLKAQQARCAICGGLLLHADQEPQHPDEWEQWITAVRKAVRRQAITIDAGPGTPDQRIIIRLIHAHCRRRLPDGADGGPALLQS